MEKAASALKAHFNIARHDKDGGSEAKWTFTEEHLAQKVVHHPSLVGKTFTMTQQFPLPLRVARFVPYQDFFYYSVRKCTQHPWDAQEPNPNPQSLPAIYCNMQQDKTEIFRSMDDQAFKIRTTERIGPSHHESQLSAPYVWPLDLDHISLKSSEQLDKLMINEVFWREYENKGILEGIQFKLSDQSTTERLGQGKSLPLHKHCTLGDQKLSKIALTFNSQMILGLEFLNCEGKIIGERLQSSPHGSESEPCEQVFISLLPEERLIGVEVQELQLKPGQPDSPLFLGSLAFRFLSRAKEEGNIHYEYAGMSLSWDQQHELITSQGNQLLTLQEAQAFVKSRKGVLFPGEDQWAAVRGKDGKKDWIQLGNKHHTPGRSHSDFGYPGWGDTCGNFVWRNCFIWKVGNWMMGKEKPKIHTLKGEQGNSCNLFLSTLKVFRFLKDQPPLLVKEILCESNLSPAMDYGPSVVYYDKSLYYFKRLYNQSVTLQLFKFDLESYLESIVKGQCFTEEGNHETKIQFFERAECQSQFRSEEEFLATMLVSRKVHTTQPWEERNVSTFRFYSLLNVEEPIYDSGSIAIQYISKLVCWRQDDNLVRLYFYNTKKKYSMLLATKTGLQIGREDDLGQSIRVSQNANDYHEDWPYDLKHMRLQLKGGKEIEAQYFLVLSKTTQAEIIHPHLEGKEHEQVASQIRDILMGYLDKGERKFEKVTVLDRPDSDFMVPFPAFVPQPMLIKLFEGEVSIDFHRKIYESYNGRALILYCLAGREILIATLRRNSQYFDVQEALASSYPKAPKFNRKPKMAQGLTPGQDNPYVFSPQAKK